MNVEELGLQQQREWAVETVKEGMKSEHWKLVRGQILEWIADEERILNYYKEHCAQTEKEIRTHLRAIDRKEYLKMLLNINETIIAHNLSFMEKAKEAGERVLQVAESFVKEKTESVVRMGESFVEKLSGRF